MSEDTNIPEIGRSAQAHFAEANSMGGPSNWKQALASLISARSSILKIEGKQAAAEVFKKLALALVALFFLLVTWLLLMTGLVGILTEFSPMNWWQSALAVGGGHLLIAIILLLVAKSIGSEPFPISRKEFEKDREWLNQLKQQSKSPS